MESETLTLVGRILDPEGHPVPRAVARSRFWAHGHVEAVADEAGRFRLGPLNRDRMWQLDIWIEPDPSAPRGLCRQRFTVITAWLPPEHELGDLHLAPGCRVAGRVLRHDGTPVAAARVEATQRYHQLCHTVRENGPAWTFTTDGEGRFESCPLPPGAVSFQASTPGVPHASGQLEILPHERRRQLDELRFLARKIEIGGVVRTDAGAPLPGARVIANHDFENAVTTDDTGRFHLVAEEDHVWKVGATMPGYRGVGVCVDDPAVSLELVLTPVEILRGSVRTKGTGEPVEITDISLCTVVRRQGDVVHLIG